MGIKEYEKLYQICRGYVYYFLRFERNRSARGHRIRDISISLSGKRINCWARRNPKEGRQGVKQNNWRVKIDWKCFVAIAKVE